MISLLLLFRQVSKTKKNRSHSFAKVTYYQFEVSTATFQKSPK